MPGNRLAVALAATVLVLTCGVAGRMVGAAMAEAAPSLRAAAPSSRVQGPSLLDGVYTAQQAERGAELYRRRCSECHQPEQYKGFLRRWVGLPVSFFYDVVSSTMPQNNPGSLDRDEYTDVITYIFSINGAPAGDEEMDSDAATLDAITIAVPPASDTP